MLASWKSIGTVISIWLGLLILLFLHTFLGRQETTRFVYSSYMVITAFLLTKLYEKRSIVERFGLQRNNVLGLLASICLGLIIVYNFGVEYLTGIIIAPFIEELFFRGYLLGARRRRSDQWEWTADQLVWISFTSILFALSHVFKYYVTDPSSMLFPLLSIFVFSIVLGCLYIRLRTILWCFLVHMLYNLSSAFGITVIVFYLFTTLSVIILSMYLVKLRTQRNNRKARNSSSSC